MELGTTNEVNPEYLTLGLISISLPTKGLIEVLT
jgi:hypothetical protein